MKWHYLRGAVFSLIQCLCAVLCEGLDIHVPWNKGSGDGERIIFNGSLGNGWSYFMSKQSRSDSAYELLSLDSSSGCLYLKSGDICSLLESNPLEMKIQGRTHYHLHQSVSNYSVTTLNIHFQNLSCSVPAHRKTAYSSLEKHSILIVLFSNVFTKSESFKCFEKNTPILNLKQYIAFSLQSFCTVMTQDRNFFYNSSSSFVTSRSFHCVYSSRLKIPVILMPCTEDTESVSVLIDIHLLDNAKKDNDFSVVRSSVLSSHERLKRQTRPQFTEQEYVVSVPENQGQGYSVIHLSAYDPDTGEAGILTYSMAATHNTFSDSMFALDPMSGIVTTTQALDREQIPTHIFRVTVTDSGTLRRSATATLIINVADENDHTPNFDHDVYEATPDENIAVKSVIISVQATDGDINENADIRYSIISPPNSDTFSIDPNDGSVSTLRTLDRERQEYYQLVVQAIDLAPLGKRRSSSATINISVQDENDNAPQFQQSSYSVNVTENLDVSSRPVIAMISATDADAGDNAKVYYTITNGNTNNTFYIDPITGNVVVQKELDYEKTRDFQLRIKASDGGDIAKQNSTTLWIRVEDLNDNPPYFQLSLYKGSISESVKSGTSVLTVHALDNDSGDNALLTYSLVDVLPSFPFEINGNSGKISVRGTVDREIEENYEFIVQVKDNGNPSLSAATTVHITVNDVNDNSPVFTQKIYNVSVSEATSLYKQIVQVTAVDSDSPSYATLRYEITSGNTQQVFAIDRSTGMITLQKQLDYKIQNKYILTVRAYDNEDLFDSAEVHIDVTYINKQPPSFEKSEYRLTVTEGVDIGTSVGKVFASDTDFGENGRVTYEILDNIQEFAIDANTGEITTREVLDRELAPGHSFDVRASDHGNPSMKDTVSVIVFVADANDNAPEFKQKIYNGNVSEAAFDNSLVLTVSATDDDDGINARIIYKFAENMNGNGDFEIDESSGAIRVAKNNHIDREEQSNYTLTVLAVDGGHTPLTGTATVKIKVDDINDNAPKFPSEDIISYVPENQPIGSTVAVVEAQDPDEGVNAIIEYSIEGGTDADKFVLSNQPGKPAYIINHIDLDYESDRKEYVVRVKAESKNLISAANVIIKVKDVNDNAPVLKDFAIIFNNYVDHFPNGPIGRIPAFDPDVSDQSKLIYKFVTGNKAGYLKLNESTGEITLNSRLNSDIPRNGTIQVKVTDGVNEVEATCRLQVRLVTIDMLENSVTIRINNMTSNSFLSPLYTFFIDALAVILNVEQNNIFVINVRNDTDVDAQILNVTVAVREKSVPVDRQTVDVFYTPEYLKEKIYLKRTLLANLSTLQILPFDDNLCIVEMCPYFMKCLSKLRFGEAAPFIASDTMLFRPIYPDNGYRCQCPEGFTWYDTFKICDREVNLCYSNPCQNGASCHSKEGGYTCECKTGFAGEYCEIDMSAQYENGMCPQDVCQAPSHCVPLIEGGFRCDGCPNTEDYNSFCELTARSFPVKGSYLTYPTVKSRYRFKIQLRFATQEPNALLFYNGRFNDLHDFMALEIVNSQVQFSFSTGEQVVKVSPYIDGGINDGKWHQVIVDYLNMTATVSVGEDCDPEISVRYGQLNNYTCAARGSLELGPACFKEGNVNNCGQLLDLTGPLQIGGLPTLNSNFQIQNKNYVGCMKDFYIDNDLLDFNKFVADHGTVAGCDRKNDFCRVAPCKHGGTCLEGWDSYLCACPQSWAGKDCSLAIEKPRTLDGTTYLTFNIELIPQVYFSKGWYNGISFRTRSANGTLLFIVTEGRETIHMQMVNGYIEYTYVSSGASTQTFVFNSVQVNDGQWHFFEVRWNDAGQITMDLDYGQRKQIEKVFNNLEGQGMEYVYAGAIKIVSARPVNFFTGCIQNVQVGNAKNSVLQMPEASNIPKGCSSGDSCTSSPCNSNAQCVTEWEGYRCECPPGTLGPNCDSICTNFNPCKNEGSCRHPAGGTFECQCGENQSGKYCENVREPCSQRWWGYPICGPCPGHCTVENGFNPSCDKQTGQCSCRDNYYKPLGSDICLPCDCYGHGSTSLTCNPVTGQCPCVEGVIGRRCDQCPSKYAEIRKEEDDDTYKCRVDYSACPRIFSHGMWWDTEVANVMIIQDCPDNAEGQALRNCTAEGLWQEPDFFNCTHTGFLEHLKKINEIDSGILEINTFVAKTTMSSLAQTTLGIETMFGNDLNISLRILNQILDKENKESGLNLTSEQDSHFLSNLVSVLSDILQGKYSREWSRLNQDGDGTGEVIRNLEIYLSTLLSALELTNQNQESPTPYNIITDNIVLSVDYINKRNFTGRRIPKFDNIVKAAMFDEDTNIMLPTSIISSTPLQDFLQPVTVAPKAYVGYIMFKQFGNLLPDRFGADVRKLENRPLTINSPVFTVIVRDDGSDVNGTIKDPVVITFKQLQNQNRTSPQCAAWLYNSRGIGEWSTAGCSVIERFNIDDGAYVKCSCSHMTSYALIMDVSDQEYVPSQPVSLQVITYIGLVVCMTCLVATYTILFFPKRVQSNTNSIHLNLMFVMFIAQLAFIVGIEKTEQELFCRLVAIALHYFYMTGFSWLFVDILHVYRMLTEIRNIDQGSMKFYYLIAYVIPGIIVSLAVGLNTEGYGSKNFCWLSMAEKFIWSFAGPITICVMVNVFVFVLAMRVSCREKLAVSDVTPLRIGMFANIIVLMLWGVIWMMGLLSVNYNYASLHVVYALLCLALGVAVFLMYMIANKLVRFEIKRLWYKIRGQKLELDDNIGGTRSSVYSRSALAYRNDSCDNGLSRINVGISTTSTTSRSTSKSSGGLYKGDEYLRSTSTSTSTNMPPVRYPKPGALPAAYGYDADKMDGVDPDSMQIRTKRGGDDSDSESEMSEHLDLASSHSSDDEDEIDVRLDWESNLPKNKKIEVQELLYHISRLVPKEEAREQIRKKKEEMLQQQQQQQQPSPMVPTTQHQYHNPFDHIYSGTPSPKFSPKPLHTPGQWPGDPQLSSHTGSDSEYRSEPPTSTLSSTQPDVTLQTPEYKGREFKIATPRFTDSIVHSEAALNGEHLHSPLGSPQAKHSPRQAPGSPPLQAPATGSPGKGFPDRMTVKVLTHRGSISSDSECSHETCV